MRFAEGKKRLTGERPRVSPTDHVACPSKSQAFCAQS